MKVLTVVGVRPQFIKAAVVSEQLREADVQEVLVHTGQHYDVAMSEVFFGQLGLPKPVYDLAVGSGAHGDQTGRMLIELERVMQIERPERVIVYGDTNSTLAGALAAAKLQIPVDHVEAGLRSFDRDMPEEVNRLLTDRLADLLLCPTSSAVSNLAHEGLTEGVVLTGDVMLDLAIRLRPAALATRLPPTLHEGKYFLATLHRASNTDDPSQLACVIQALDRVARDVSPVILPAHPRLRARLEEYRLTISYIQVTEPTGYLETQGLIARARGVITDSGGLQKEAFFNSIPCLTLRDSTEWVETVDEGLNVLVGNRLHLLSDLARNCVGPTVVPDSVFASFGSGIAGKRVAAAIRDAGSRRRRWTASSEVARASRN